MCAVVSIEVVVKGRECKRERMYVWEKLKDYKREGDRDSV